MEDPLGPCVDDGYEGEPTFSEAESDGDSDSEDSEGSSVESAHDLTSDESLELVRTRKPQFEPEKCFMNFARANELIAVNGTRTVGILDNMAKLMKERFIKRKLETVEDFETAELELVADMNKLMGYVLDSNKIYVVSWNGARLVPCAKDRYKLEEAFRNWTVPTCNVQDLSSVKIFRSERTCLMKNRSKEELVVKLNPRVNYKGRGKKRRPDLAVRIEERTLFDIWFNHPARRNYSSCRMDPRCSETLIPGFQDVLNTWSGFALPFNAVRYQRDYKKIIPFLLHLWGTWCSSEKDYCSLLSRFAMLLQQPWNKQGICNVVLGMEGSGKTFVYEVLCQIIGREHSIILQDERDIIGDFTGITADKILVVVDDCLIKNSKFAAVMKNAITNSLGRVHGKYKDLVYVPNFTNYAILSNQENDALELSLQARRYQGQTSDTSPLLKHPLGAELWNGDSRTYWTYLRNSMKNGGLETLANFLYSWDVSKFDTREIEPNRAIMIQKLNCMKPIERFMVWVLVTKSNMPLRDMNGNSWSDSLLLEDFFQSFELWFFSNVSRSDKDASKRRRVVYPCNSAEEFWTKIGAYFPQNAKVYFDARCHRKILEIAPVNNPDGTLKLSPYDSCVEHFNAICPGFKLLLETDSDGVVLFDKPFAVTQWTRIKEMTSAEIIKALLPTDWNGRNLRNEIACGTYWRDELPGPEEEREEVVDTRQVAEKIADLFALEQ